MGKYVSVCKACGKLGGSRGMLSREILIFGLFITYNLLESGTVFTHTIIHHINFIASFKLL